MATELHFTQESISKIICPKTKQDYYNDTKVVGLLLIASSGKNKSKVFYLRTTVGGKQRHIKLGSFSKSDISVAEARNKAIALKAQFSKDINPVEKLAISNNQIDNQSPELTFTFKEFFYKYIEEHSKRKNKCWENDVDQMNRCGTDFYTRKISTITRDDIQKVFNDVSNNRGPIAANRFYALLSSMFNRAIEWDVLVKNPTDTIEENKEIPRERYIATKEEMSRILKAIYAEPNKTMADFFLMLLFTGARKGNVQAMKWQDINFENKTWSIPAKETKNGKTQRVHLVEYAISLLLERRKNENNPKAIWVFPSKTSKSGHIKEPKSAWKRICKLAGMKI